MAPNLLQVYSATYSNVPVFEYVTPEGPIMRRKSDSWINATHILKIAKFPKARRTRILEKDVQTGIHEKVQGGYGKYQGTYVPLDLGAEIARQFGVYDVLKPIFDFEYVEGRSETPPPAPKHSHASASNVARRQQQLHLQGPKAAPKNKREPGPFPPGSPLNFKRMKSDADNLSSSGYDHNQYPGQHPGQPRETLKRVALPPRGKPSLAESKTVPIAPPAGSAGPSFGTFAAYLQRQDPLMPGPLPGMSGLSGATRLPLISQLPPLYRQDTERDALLIMASNMNVRLADLEADHSDSERTLRRPLARDAFHLRSSDDDEFMSGKELFGSRAFGLSQAAGSRASPESAHRLLSLNGSVSGDHGPRLDSADSEAADYFNALLNYLMDDGALQPHLAGNSSLPKPTVVPISESVSSSGSNSGPTVVSNTFNLPAKILNPPHPLLNINISRPVDDDGNTIFHWACSMANVGMIEFLLTIFSNFITSEITNYNGETPLMFLVQFRNSFQLGNFPAILDLLFDSVLAVDKNGRTVLHHVALACQLSKFDNLKGEADPGLWARKERFANYYLDVLFSKVINFPEYQLLHGTDSRSLEDKKEVIVKFINHQDNHGNTAFHVVSHKLSKKCVKTFIQHHKYIDLSLRNHLNTRVEDYLAVHNFVLRLENEDGTAVSSPENGLVSAGNLLQLEHTRSFDTQLHNTRMAINFNNSAIHLMTEKLGELSYSLDKELLQKDDKLRDLYEYLKIVSLEKFKSQKAVLQLFNLHHLVEDIAKDYGINENDVYDDPSAALVMMDGGRDQVIQEEIMRLLNDLTFQKITADEKLARELAFFKHARELAIRAQIEKSENTSMGNEADSAKASRFDLAVRLQHVILKRKQLSTQLYDQESKAPLSASQKDEFKENSSIKVEENPKLQPNAAEALQQNKRFKNGRMAISDFPPTDKLYKYCKLVALSCGISMMEVENSIDLLEQSLAKAANGG